jgi:2-keto-3-deoxy-galactonokinase
VPGSTHRYFHCVLAGTIGAQDLTQEHRQRHRRRKFALPILRQQRFERLQQVRTGDQVEKIQRIGLPRAAANLSGMLLGYELGITMSQGWPPWLWMLRSNNIVPISVVSLLLQFQSVTSMSLYRCG